MTHGPRSSSFATGASYPSRERLELSPSILALTAAAAAVLARMPFIAHHLWDHDSVQFALATERFDLAAHQPHPPGYPLYVAVLDLFTGLGAEPWAALVLVSVLASVAGAAAMAVLGYRLVGGGAAGSRAGMLAAALYVTNPLLWFYGELPLVYAVEGGLAPMVAWAVLSMPESRGRFLAACLILALAGGVRPSTLVLLAPLLLWGLAATWRRGKLTPGLFATGAGVGLVGVLAWLLPLLSAAGGLAAYRSISSEHFGALLPRTSVLYGAGAEALGHNLFLLAKWAAQGLVPAAAVLVVLWLLVPRAVPAGLRLVRLRGGFLLAWAGPPVAFFALFHLTKAGYTLIHLPALLLAAVLLATPALGPSGVVGRQEEEDRHGEDPPALAGPWARALGAVLLAVLVGSGLFLLGRDRAPEEPRWWALVRHELNHAEIRDYERDLEEALAALGDLPRRGTVLATLELAGEGAAGSEGFLYPWHRHLQWYVPDLPVVYLAPAVELAQLSPGGHRPFRAVPWEDPWPAGTERVVWVLSGDPGGRFELPRGGRVVLNERFQLHLVELQEIGAQAAGAPQREPQQREPQQGGRSQARRSEAEGPVPP